MTKTKAEKQKEYDLRTGYAAQKKYQSSGALKSINVAMKAERLEAYKRKCDELGIRYTEPLQQAIDQVLSGNFKKP